MSSITGSWLAETIPKIIAMLEIHGFLVDSIVAGGASENRSGNAQLATLTAGNLLHPSDDQCSKLPLEKKIASPHPTRDDIIVFIWSDMAHWVKKFVNALPLRERITTAVTRINFFGVKHYL
jgi:hypothetical protein